MIVKRTLMTLLYFIAMIWLGVGCLYPFAYEDYPWYGWVVVYLPILIFISNADQIEAWFIKQNEQTATDGNNTNE